MEVREKPVWKGNKVLLQMSAYNSCHTFLRHTLSCFHFDVSDSETDHIRLNFSLINQLIPYINTCIHLREESSIF